LRELDKKLELVESRALNLAKEALEKAMKNARKMSDNEIVGFFGDTNWHKSKEKKALIEQYRKQLQGSTNVDFLLNKDTGEVFIKGNKNDIIIKVGDL